MGMFGDFFRYFMSVVMGRRDPLTSFLEPLTMAERYLKWGLENGDIRDFRAALDHLHLCVDQDAPMPGLLLRKYNCLLETATAAVDSLLLRHNKVLDAAAKTESDYREERATILKSVSAARERVRKFQEEGSLIKAKTEERRIEELTETAANMQELLDSGDARTEVFESYDRVVSECVRFFREVDQAAVTVTLADKLGSGASEALAGQLRNRLEYLKKRTEDVNPAAEGEAAAPPPGGKSGGGKQ